MTPGLKSEGKKNEKQFVRGSAPGGEKQKGRRMENSSSGALPRGGQKNRMKNIFEKEDTEEHFDWGSALPRGGDRREEK